MGGVIFLGSFSLWIHCCCSNTDPHPQYRFSSYRSNDDDSFHHYPIIGILDSGSRRGSSAVDNQPNYSDCTAVRGRGLDTAEIDAIPSISYGTLKKKKQLRLGGSGGGSSLECAVCLAEFEGKELLLQLLPKCDHVFHPHCIRAWLADHTTCPVCRVDLVLDDIHSKEKKINTSHYPNRSGSDIHQAMISSSASQRNRDLESGSDIDQEMISSSSASERNRDLGSGIDQATISSSASERNRDLEGEPTDEEEEMGKRRSNDSTGSRTREESRAGGRESFTVRLLPEGIIREKMRRSLSMEALPKLSSSRSSMKYRSGEGSLGRSDQWTSSNSSSSATVLVSLQGVSSYSVE